MDLNTARRLAAQIVADLAPACHRIEVAGSVRREKPNSIHDIEIVAIPRAQRLTFGHMASADNALVALTNELRGQGRMIPRLDSRGRAAWGERFRRAVWAPDGHLAGAVPLDLFITNAARWGVIFTLRTGDAEFSHGLVTQRALGGAMPEGMCIDEGRVWRGDVALNTPEEGDVFDALGVPWIAPTERTRHRLLAAVA